jgi:hypothetical protein
MAKTDSAIIDFPLRFPSVDQLKSKNRNDIAEYQVPAQPEIEWLLLRSLAEHLEIPADQNMWRELALRLARELLPEPMRQGAKVKWSKNQLVGFVGEMNRLTSRKGQSFSNRSACNILADKMPWKGLVKSESRVNRKISLYQKYYQLKRDEDFFKEANLIYKKLQQQDGWKAFIQAL